MVTHLFVWLQNSTTFYERKHEIRSLGERIFKKRLMPMIRKHDDPPVFWPDFASCHYSRSVTEWYQQNGVDFVPKKNMNPANVPQLRLIEKFQASMKRKLCKKGKIATDINQFRQISGVASRNFTKTVVQKLIEVSALN